MKPILIHKGDCTVFADCKRFLTFNIETDLDLTGWKAKFVLGLITKEITDISSKSFEIVLGADDTKQLRLGLQNASIILTDAEGHIKTVANNIPFEVTTAIVENEYQDIDLTIPESSGVDIKLRVGMQGGTGAVNSVNGMTGDVVIDIPSLDGYVKNTDIAGDDVLGVVATSPTKGLAVVGNGTLQIIPATETMINSRTSGNRALTLHMLDYGVKTSITDNKFKLTDEEKASAKSWLGYADQTDIMQAIASIPRFKLSIVNELPLAGEKMTLYLVPKEGTDNDIYNEYIWIEQTSSFEHLGSTAVDLTDYVKNTDYATQTTGGVIKINSSYGLDSTKQNGILAPATYTLSNYKAKASQVFIGKGTLENVLTQYSKTVSLTQADYDALETKDTNTLYLIEE